MQNNKEREALSARAEKCNSQKLCFVSLRPILDGDDPETGDPHGNYFLVDHPVGKVPVKHKYF